MKDLLTTRRNVRTRDDEVPQEGIFRYQVHNGIGSLGFVLVGLLFAGLILFSEAPRMVVLPLFFAALGLAYFIPFWNRRVEADKRGLRIFNVWGACLLDEKWDRITGYLASSSSQGYWGGWSVETVLGTVEVPRVDGEDRLQQIIVARLAPGVLRQHPNHQRPSSKPQTEEIHLVGYRDSNDYATAFVCCFGLLLFGVSTALLIASVIEGTIVENPLVGLGVGVLITLLILACRWMLRRLWVILKGREVDMTSLGIHLRESGKERTMAWTDLVLVERRYLSNFNRQGTFVMLFDGRTTLAYHSEWKHADALLRYVSQEAPAETVFAGFE